MARIKHTKNELKAQREALRRYERYLPMLQLKKQQLQAEILSIDHQLRDLEAREADAETATQSWIDLFSEPAGLESLLRVRAIRTDDANIAGVTIPVLRDVDFEVSPPDLFATPPWVDAAVPVLEERVRFLARRRVLEEQKRLIGDELRITSQRVNLFEKVKIPECRENIRVIRIFLGDQQTASVARAKIAKSHAGGRGDEPAAAPAAEEPSP